MQKKVSLTKPKLNREAFVNVNYKECEKWIGVYFALVFCRLLNKYRRNWSYSYIFSCKFNCLLALLYYLLTVTYMMMKIGQKFGLILKCIELWECNLPKIIITVGMLFSKYSGHERSCLIWKLVGIKIASWSVKKSCYNYCYLSISDNTKI